MKIALLLFLGLCTLYAQTLPPFAFLAYSDDRWKVCVVKDTKVSEIDLEEEPHSFDYNFKNGDIIYVGANSKLRLRSQNSEREVKLPYDRSGFTQPSFLCEHNAVYAVELINKSSRSTKIVKINLQNDSFESVVMQNSSQFEPLECDDRNILFTNLICNQGCGKLIQEIWLKNTITGISEQVTLLNAFSTNPTVHYGSHMMFFNSNKGDNYNIWAKELSNDEKSFQVTFSEAVDTDPVAIDERAFLYIRNDNARQSIMYGDLNGKFYEIKLLKEYNKIRQLKVNRCD